MLSSVKNGTLFSPSNSLQIFSNMGVAAYRGTNQKPIKFLSSTVEVQEGFLNRESVHIPDQ